MTHIRRAAGLAAVLLLLADGAMPQPLSAPGPAARSSSGLCRAPEALTLFAVTVRQVLAGRGLGRAWPVYQIPCDVVSVVGEMSPAILVVDRAFAGDQEIRQYGLTPLPFADTVEPPREPDDPFARLGRLIVRPALSSAPGVWIKGDLYPTELDRLRLAVAAGSVHALSTLSDAACATGPSGVASQLLSAATTQTRNLPDYQLYFEAALLEHRSMTDRAVAILPKAAAVQQDLQRAVVPGLRCDAGKRDRFSLMPFGPGATVLARAAQHLRAALSGLATRGRADLGELNLAQTCVLDAVTEMLRSQRAPSCTATDYGLWTRAYAPLLHAAQVKALWASR